MSSANDRAVLDTIFNPLLPAGEAIQEEEQLQEQALGGKEDEPLTPEQEEAKRLEVEGVAEAEKGNIDTALKCFDRAIALAPDRASGFNNRAQALRLKGNVEGAMEDLNNAINLGQEGDEGGRKGVREALCQRALVNRLQGKEEEAFEDFKRAAALGSSFAKSQVVALNPYAALCNRMLSDMVDKLRRGEVEEEEKAE